MKQFRIEDINGRTIGTVTLGDEIAAELANAAPLWLMSPVVQMTPRKIVGFTIAMRPAKEG